MIVHRSAFSGSSAATTGSSQPDVLVNVDVDGTRKGRICAVRIAARAWVGGVAQLEQIG